MNDDFWKKIVFKNLNNWFAIGEMILCVWTNWLWCVNSVVFACVRSIKIVEIIRKIIIKKISMLLKFVLT